MGGGVRGIRIARIPRMTTDMIRVYYAGRRATRRVFRAVAIYKTLPLGYYLNGLVMEILLKIEDECKVWCSTSKQAYMCRGTNYFKNSDMNARWSC